MKHLFSLLLLVTGMLASLSLRAQCAAPTQFSLSENGYSHAVLTWSAPEGVSQWILTLQIRNTSNYYQYSFIVDTLQLTPDAEGHVSLLLDTLPAGVIVNAYLQSFCDSITSYSAPVVQFCTPCAPVPAGLLPWFYGFEDYSNVPGLGTVINPCWWLSPQNNTDSIGRPMSITNNPAEGNRSLMLYSNNATLSSWVSAPLFVDSLQRLEIQLQAKGSGLDVSFEIGVMTNPLDYNTFVPIKTCSVPSQNNWTEINLNFENYEGPQGFLTFMERNGATVYIDALTVNRISCPRVNSVTLRDATATSAFIDWTCVSPYPVQPHAFVVTLSDTSGQAVATDTVTTRWMCFTDLQPAAFYAVEVRALCDTCDGLPGATSFFTRALPCVAFDSASFHSDTVGHGTATDYRIPAFSGSQYSRSQQLFRTSELGDARVLTRLAFMPASTSASRHLKVYLAHTTDTLLDGYLQPSDMSLVFDDTVTIVADQWSLLQLSTPFHYNGQGNLLVTILDDNAVLTGSALQYYVHTVPQGTSRYDYKSSFSALGDGTAMAVRNNMRFEGYLCDSSSSCAAPLVRVVDSSSTQVTVVWAPGGDETVWSVDYCQSSSAGWMPMGATTATQMTLTSLQPDQTYQIRVSHTCGDSLYATVKTVHTPCQPQSLPFSETFASWPTGNQNYLPSCWHKGNNSTNNSPYGAYFQHMGDYRSLLFHYTNGNVSDGYYTYVVLPKMEAPVDTLLLSFYMFIEYDSYNPNLRVGVVSNPSDMSTFQEVGVATQGTFGQWELHQFTFSDVDDGYITLLTPSTGYATLYVENIEVDYYNPCQPPLDITLDSVVMHTASLSWTDNGSVSYQIQYGPVGFTPGSGTTVNTTTNHVTLTNLPFETQYDVYLRGNCDGVHISNWNGPFHFTSGCNTINSLPYFEDFNNYGTGMFPPPSCWGHGSDYNNSYPQINSGLNYGTGSGSALYFLNNDYYNVGRYTYANLPALSSSVAAVNQTQLHFYAKSLTSGGPYPLVVGVSEFSADLTTFVPVDTIWTVYNEWLPYDVYLETYTGTGRYITFLQYCFPQTTGNSLCIDDIMLMPAESCHNPNNLATIATTQNTATMTWNDRAGASQWIVEYGPVGFPPGTGISVWANSNPFTLTNLPSGYNGHFYVRALCAPGDTSNYSAFYGAFVTQQQAVPTPYSYDFENPVEWLNWTVVTSYSGRQWQRGAYPPPPSDTGSYSLYVADDNQYAPFHYNATVNAVAYRDINFVGATDYLLTFDARSGGPRYDEGDGLRVFLVDPNATVINSALNYTTPWGPLDSLDVLFELGTDTTWRTYSIYIPNISGPQRLVFYWGNITRQYNTINLAAAVDNVSIAPVTCLRPENLTLVSRNSTAATLSWNGPANATYQLVYEFDRAGNSQPQTLTVQGTTATLTDLLQAHRYRCRVRRICSSVDTSVFSVPLYFATDTCSAAYWADMGDDAHSLSQSYFTPVNLLSNYSVSEIIVTQDELDSTEVDLTGLALMAMGQRTMEGKKLVEIYLMPTDKDHFTGTNDPVSLPSSAVKVYTGSLECHSGWNYFGFDTYYHYSGSGNLIMVVNDLSDCRIPSQTAFNNECWMRRCDSNMTWTAVDYNTPINLQNLSYYSSNASQVQKYRPEMKLYSCGTYHCASVAAQVENLQYDRATLRWNGGEGSYELQYRADDESDWRPTILTADTVYQFSQLYPDITYHYRLRRLCDSLRSSEWYEGSFTTAHLDCHRPTGLTATHLTTSTVDLSWDPHEGDTLWSVHVWNTVFDTLFDVDTTAFTLTGLVSSSRYLVTVSTVCGNGIVVSMPSISVAFVTLDCGSVDPVQIFDLTATSVSVRWTDISAPFYRVEIGDPGFGVGDGRGFTTESTMLTIDSLLPDHDYELYARALCGGVNTGQWSNAVSFHTPLAGVKPVGAEKMQIHPNPAHTSTTVVLKGFSGMLQLTVVDMMGHTMLDRSFYCDGDCSQTINTATLPKGAYFVQVKGENTHIVRKLVVK